MSRRMSAGTYVGDHARSTPGKAAMIHAATGAVLTYRELDDRSNRLAQLLHAHGLRRGDGIAIFMENTLTFMEVAWAAMRSGLYLTTINRYLTADEAAYIANDCGARALVSSLAMRAVAAELPARIGACPLWLMADGRVEGWERYGDAIAAHPARPLPPQWPGDAMLYSSGTTGRPKGIRRPLLPVTVEHNVRLRDALAGYGFGPDTVYLSPAPLYHAAPFAYTLGT